MGNQSSELNEIQSLIKETQKNIKDLSISQKETDRQMKASQKEMDRHLSALSASQRETDEQIKATSIEVSSLSASQRETDRQIKATSTEVSSLSASQRETDRQMKASQKEMDRHLSSLSASQREMSKEIQKAQNLFTTQWGRLMESLVEGDLVRLLQERGLQIERTSTNEKGLMSYVDEKGVKQQERCEIDIIAKNGQEIVVVEVKTTLTVRDVHKFLDVLNRFPRLLPEYRDKKVYGAVAYLRTQDSSDVYSEKQGLFIIKATGSSASITNQENFKPKLFCQN